MVCEPVPADLQVELLSVKKINAILLILRTRS